MKKPFDDRRVNSVIAGKYRVEKLIAQGGFSSVYRGLQLGMDRPVAIKVLELEQDRDISPTWLHRFEREAKLVSQLTNPNTITIYDFGREDCFLYIVMEYIRGRSLSRQIKRHGAIGAQDSTVIALAILRSLDEAHELGILHRDLKPSNIMLGRDYNDELIVKVLDFGVAKLLEPEDDNASQLTQAGAFVGTPRYASPEQMRRETLTAASDIYGVGMILWECLTGKPPVPTTDFSTCVAYHLGPDPWRLGPEVDCPPTLATIIHRALEKDHTARFQSCREMLADLETYLPTMDTIDEMDATYVESGVPDAVAAFLTRGNDDSTTVSSDSIDATSNVFFSPSNDFGQPTSGFQPDTYFDPDARPNRSTNAGSGPIDVFGHPLTPAKRDPADNKDDTTAIYKRAIAGSQNAPKVTSNHQEVPKRPLTQAPAINRILLGAIVVLIAILGLGLGVWMASEEAEVNQTVDAAKSKQNQPMMIPAKTLFMGLRTAKWRVGKISENDLGDVVRHATMVMKGPRVANITVYECDDVETAIALLEDTSSPDEAVQFGRTLVRISPGPSSAQNGVQAATKMLFAFRGLMEDRGDL